MKAVVAAFNQEKALVGAFSVITNLRMEIFEALIQARLELGPYDLGLHTPAFFRQNLERFLPEHAVRRSGGLWSWLPWSANSKSSPEARLIEQFKVQDTHHASRRNCNN